MINVYVISGFLGAGKTTFIQKLLKEKKFEKVMLLENEFGEVGVDGAFFDSSLKVREINNGCICCSLQGDFEEALEEIEEMGVTDLLIEPSGVGKLSEIINVIKADDDFRIISHICIVDVKTAMKYHNNFKEYFDDQVVSANAIILSHTDVATAEQIEKVKTMVSELNHDVDITAEPIAEMPIEKLLDIIVSGGEILPEIDDDDDDDDDHDHEHEHHHDHDHEHHHHHHDHDHDHDHEHEHHHHHHHDDDDDEDEIFKNVILRPAYVFKQSELENILGALNEDIIRAKGYVNGEDGTLYFNYILNEYHTYYGEKREGSLVSVIGTVLDHDALKEAFHE